MDRTSFDPLPLPTTRPANGRDQTSPTLESATDPESPQGRIAELEQRCVNLERAVESYRRVSLALGIIMATLKVTDDQAFDHLRAVSQRQHRKLRDLAEEVILTGAVPSSPDLHQVAGRSRGVRAPSRLRIVEDHATICLEGETDLASIADLAPARELIGDTTTVAIVVDCADLTFIDCAGLGELIEWNVLAARRGKVLYVSRVPPVLRRLLDLCGLSATLTITDYLDDTR